MNLDFSLVEYFWHASFIVKIVLLLLLSASVYSWVIIIQKHYYFKSLQLDMNIFERKVWSTPNINQLYREVEADEENFGIKSIFMTALKEYFSWKKRTTVKTPDEMNEHLLRVMYLARIAAIEDLESDLPFLATVGSTSPYIGLFGTVWGIMMAFQALGHTTQATIAMVAPGISEALIATAMGLFAAIPAVIAYNRYTHTVSLIINHYEAFEEKLAGALYRSFENMKNQEVK